MTGVQTCALPIFSRELEAQEAEDVIQLEELDDEAEEEPFRLG